MNRLQETLGDRIDVINLDVEQSITRDIRQEYGILERTRYVLLDSEGKVVQRWFGTLNEGEIYAFIEEYLASVEAS